MKGRARKPPKTGNSVRDECYQALVHVLASNSWWCESDATIKQELRDREHSQVVAGEVRQGVDGERVRSVLSKESESAILLRVAGNRRQQASASRRKSSHSLACKQKE